MNSARRARPARRARAVTAACVVAILPLAGCSDDKKKEAAPTSETSVRPVDTSFSGQDSAEFCTFITTFTEGSQNVSPTASPAELEASFQKALAAIDQSVAVAPVEIKGDVSAIRDTFDTVVTAVSDAGFDLARVDPSALQALQGEGFLDSVTRLQAYLTTVCRTGG
ncbi:MAG TPA: hypothetical protein VM942_02620 [Acidimicrobiales bacterium]|nr:hypothetical protein [Acidimicrobiales bacterium]